MYIPLLKACTVPLQSSKMGEFMYEDLISVVVPVYNTEKYVRRCVDSILCQTYKNLEIILIDDESPDNAGTICDELKGKYSNIVVEHKKNAGLGYARNSGIKIANGKYITFIDSDDYIAADHIDTLYRNITSNKAEVSYCGHTKVNGEEEIQNRNIFEEKVFTGTSIKTEVIPRMCGQTGSCGDCIQMSACMALYSLDFIKEHGLRFVSEREYVSEDLIFNLEYAEKANTISFSEDVGYFYMFNDSSLSHSYLPDRFEKSKIMMREVSERTKKIGVYDLCEQRIINSLLVNTRVSLQSEQKNSEKIGKKEAFKRFSLIVFDNELHESLNKYKSEGVRIQARIINFLIFHRMPRLLWQLMFIRNVFNI